MEYFYAFLFPNYRRSIIYSYVNVMKIPVFSIWKSKRIKQARARSKCVQCWLYYILVSFVFSWLIEALRFLSWDDCLFCKFKALLPLCEVFGPPLMVFGEAGLTFLTCPSNSFLTTLRNISIQLSGKSQSSQLPGWTTIVSKNVIYIFLLLNFRVYNFLFK